MDFDLTAWVLVLELQTGRQFFVANCMGFYLNFFLDGNTPDAEWQIEVNFDFIFSETGEISSGTF